jgi:hypothetical protein
MSKKIPYNFVHLQTAIIAFIADFELKVHQVYPNIPVLMEYNTIADNYSGIWVTILNRKEGPVDTVYLSFSEILGKKQVNNPNFREGVIPHIWTNEGKDQWYAYQPVKSDYRKVTEKVCVECLKGFAEALVATGSQPVYVPRNQFHVIFLLGNNSYRVMSNR